MELSRLAQGQLAEDSARRQSVVDGAEFLGQLLLQDIERKSCDGDEGVSSVEVLPGNALDNLGALELVEQSEANTGVPVLEAMGDAACGDGVTRQAFADAGRKLVARVPGRPDRQRFPKDDFVIDLAAGSCTCPAGQVTHNIVPAGRRTDGTGRVHRLRAFQFDGSGCMTCPLWSQCISAEGRKG